MVPERSPSGPRKVPERPRSGQESPPTRTCCEGHGPVQVGCSDTRVLLPPGQPTILKLQFLYFIGMETINAPQSRKSLTFWALAQPEPKDSGPVHALNQLLKPET